MAEKRERNKSPVKLRIYATVSVVTLMATHNIPLYKYASHNAFGREVVYTKSIYYYYSSFSAHTIQAKLTETLLVEKKRRMYNA